MNDPAPQGRFTQKSKVLLPLLRFSIMSQEQNLEEGTAGEHRDGTNSVSGNIQMQEIRSIRKLQKSSCNIAKGQPCVKKIFDTHGSYGNWVFLVWCVIVIFVDTWFLYIPMVNDCILV